MKILLLDNYDSFTYNLVQYVEEIVGTRPTVVRNDQMTVEEAADFDKILLSPGPGLPAESGILCPLIKRWAGEKSIFGVCLGLQAIGEVFGGRLENLENVFHGVATRMLVTDPTEPIFQNIPDQFEAGRYHSWVVSKMGLPEVLKITCEDENGQIMAMRHREFDVRGVQFHPESILTPDGKIMLQNWLVTPTSRSGK